MAPLPSFLMGQETPSPQKLPSQSPGHWSPSVPCPESQPFSPLLRAQPFTVCPAPAASEVSAPKGHGHVVTCPITFSNFFAYCYDQPGVQGLQKVASVYFLFLLDLSSHNLAYTPSGYDALTLYITLTTYVSRPRKVCHFPTQLNCCNFLELCDENFEIIHSIYEKEQVYARTVID